MLRILALVPPHRSGERTAAYSFLVEELARLAASDVELHAVSPYVERRIVIDRVTLHPAGRFRQSPRVGRLARFLMNKTSRLGVGGLDVRETLWLARWQLVIEDVLRRETIDVIYSPFAWPKGTGGAPAAAAAGVPLVISLRGADVLVEPSIGYGQALDAGHVGRISAALHSAAHVIGVSRSLADRAVELGADPKRVSVILKGVDHERFTPGDTRGARHALGLEDRPTVLFVGNLIPRKGVDVLLDAVQRVQATLPDLQLIVCGTGPEQDRLQRLTEQLGLGGHVRFAGWVERPTIPQYFQACDVFVLPSLTEGSGNVLVEAAACAKPVIGTNVAGIPDYVEGGVTGWLFEKGDPADLAEKLLKVLTDPQQSAEMGHAARTRAESQHRYDQMTASILDVFRKVTATS